MSEQSFISHSPLLPIIALPPAPSPPPTPPTPCVEKLSSMKLVPGVKKVGDLWGRGLQWQPHPLCITQQWLLASMVAQAFPASFPHCGATYSDPFTLSLHSQQLSPPWVCSPNPTFQHQTPLCTWRHTSQPEECRPTAQNMRANLTLSCLPQTGCCIPL